MRVQSPALLPLLRSQVQGDLLALMYLEPEREFTVTEAAHRVESSLRAVHHEIGRLVQAGLLADRRHGNNRLVRAVTDSPLSRPLTDLLAVTYGPLPVLTSGLAAVRGVERAFIYGSWAARYTGEPGPPPHDVDVLVVGGADPDELDVVAQAAERRLGREVNIRRIKPETWAQPASEDAFLTSVRSRPLIELDLAAARVRS
jgi:DNA-binding transcriptional ArsR family regulator